MQNCKSRGQLNTNASETTFIVAGHQFLLINRVFSPQSLVGRIQIFLAKKVIPIVYKIDQGLRACMLMNMKQDHGNHSVSAFAKHTKISHCLLKGTNTEKHAHVKTNCKCSKHRLLKQFSRQQIKGNCLEEQLPYYQGQILRSLLSWSGIYLQLDHGLGFYFSTREKPE